MSDSSELYSTEEEYSDDFIEKIKSSSEETDFDNSDNNDEDVKHFQHLKKRKYNDKKEKHNDVRKHAKINRYQNKMMKKSKSVQVRDLIKGPEQNMFSYNISIPKNAINLLINLKRRNLDNITLICTFGESPKIVAETSSAIVISNV